MGIYGSVPIWMEKDGIIFLKHYLGMREGMTVVDFGCNEGHYTIPAAMIAGANGKVYAVDMDTDALKFVEEKAGEYGLDNIVVVNTHGGYKLPIPSRTVDIFMIYDVLHYMEKDMRLGLYGEAARVLKKDGLLSVHPKHTKNDWPMWHLADLMPEDIANEIINSGFRQIFAGKVLLFHDDDFDKGFILNFGPVI